MSACACACVCVCVRMVGKEELDTEGIKAQDKRTSGVHRAA